MSRLVLASSSPRRRELLKQAGFSFEVLPAHLNEDLHPGEEAITYVTRLAREKAEAVFQRLVNSRGQGRGDATSEAGSQRAEPRAGDSLIVLGADTTVTLDGHILAKPEDPADAARMLRMLSGRTHQVITGVAVVSGAVSDANNSEHRAAPRIEVAAEVTGVRFVTLSEEDISEYVATGEPMDKAGSYGIQGRAAKWIPRVEGCYFNVMGLPLALVTAMLEGLT